MYKVVFYTLQSGRSPVNEFMISANKSLRSKITKEIEQLKEFGLTSLNHHLRKIVGTPLWEIRILGRDSTRIICVALTQKRVVILNIFKKKGNKTPSREILISLKRFKALDKYI